MFLSEWHKFPSAPYLAEGGEKKKLNDSLCLNVVEITCVPDMLPSLFPSWSGYGLISTPVCIETEHMKGLRFQEIEKEPYTCFLLYHQTNIVLNLKEFSLASTQDITLLVSRNFACPIIVLSMFPCNTR